MVYVPYLNETLNALVAPVKYLLSSTKPVSEQFKISNVYPPPCTMIVRLAGISGALSVLAGAYGAHSFGPDREKDKSIFQTGAHYQLIHSVALLGAPHSRHPYSTAGLFIVGMTLFCGSCYYVAVTKDTRFSKIAPIGGVTLVAAWLSLMI